MSVNAKFTEETALLAVINPASLSTGATVSAYVSVRDYVKLCALVTTGVLGTGATVDVKLVQAKDSSGTDAKDISGKAITQIVKATGDNKQVFINCDSSDLDLENGFLFAAVSVTVGTAASIAQAHLFGHAAKNQPVTQLTTVAQVV